MICQYCKKHFKEGTGIVDLNKTTNKQEELYCSRECQRNAIKTYLIAFIVGLIIVLPLAVFLIYYFSFYW